MVSFFDFSEFKRLVVYIGCFSKIFIVVVLVCGV